LSVFDRKLRWQILRELSDASPLTAANIAARLHVDPPTAVAHALFRLELDLLVWGRPGDGVRVDGQAMSLGYRLLPEGDATVDILDSIDRATDRCSVENLVDDTGRDVLEVARVVKRERIWSVR
jgi:hypothetical protein